MDKKGFSLIEVLAAAIIFTIAVLGIGALFFSSVSYMAEIREISIATHAINEEMESIRGMSYDEVLALGTTFTATGFSNLHNVTGTISVDNVYSEDNIRRVSLAVTWASLRGVSVTRRLVTLVTKSGLNG